MLPVLSSLISNGCIEFEKEETAKTAVKVSIALACSDLIIFISALILGILGLCSVINDMPAAASYALIGTSAFVVSAWVVAILYHNFKNDYD